MEYNSNMMAAIGPSSEVQNESQIEFTGVSAFTIDSQILHLNHIPRLPVSECGRGSLAAWEPCRLMSGHRIVSYKTYQTLY